MTVTRTQKLAMLGGDKAVPANQPRLRWPIVSELEEEAVRRVLASGQFTSISNREQEIKALEREWAERTGTRHCTAVSNGTAAISLVLAALDLQAGDEVIVPALSFIASAVAPLHALAVPVFVDIDPRTFNLDPAAVARAVTARTRAILPVHLHGLPAEMDEIGAIAAEHGLTVVEDAAQAHGAAYRGRPVGSIGAAGTFSLNVTKNLPTCGEGGLITTDDDELQRRMLMMRQFGEVIPDQGERSYVSHLLGWNHKLNSVQAAFTRAQLVRFDADRERRDRNVRAFLQRLAGLPGLLVPEAPADRGHAWHILRFLVDPEAAGLVGLGPGPLRAALMRALRAEGVPLSHYQLMPLPAQRLFQTREGLAGGYPWRVGPAGRDYGRDYDPAAYPNTLAVIAGSFTLQHHHLHPDAGPLLDRFADAFEKVWGHLAEIGSFAAGMPYKHPWERAADLAATERAATERTGAGGRPPATERSRAHG